MVPARPPPQAAHTLHSPVDDPSLRVGHEARERATPTLTGVPFPVVGRHRSPNDIPSARHVAAALRRGASAPVSPLHGFPPTVAIQPPSCPQGVDRSRASARRRASPPGEASSSRRLQAGAHQGKFDPAVDSMATSDALDAPERHFCEAAAPPHPLEDLVAWLRGNFTTDPQHAAKSRPSPGYRWSCARDPPTGGADERNGVPRGTRATTRPRSSSSCTFLQLSFRR